MKRAVPKAERARASTVFTTAEPPTKGGTLWTGEAYSSRRHYLWFAEPGLMCAVMSGKLNDGPTVFRSGKVYSRYYAQLRRAPPDLDREVAALIGA
jgi:hypothetical protein